MKFKALNYCKFCKAIEDAVYSTDTLYMFEWVVKQFTSDDIVIPLLYSDFSKVYPDKYNLFDTPMEQIFTDFKNRLIESGLLKRVSIGLYKLDL